MTMHARILDEQWNTEGIGPEIEQDHPGSRETWLRYHRQWVRKAWTPADPSETAWNHPANQNGKEGVRV